MTIRVVIADDQPLVRSGVRTLLETDPTIEVVAEADDGQSAVNIVKEARPDVAIIDIRMPVMDGIEATRRIVADSRPSTHGLDRTPRVLVLTTFDVDDYVYRALKAGASGFVLKNVPHQQLVHAVHAVARGDEMLSPTITRRLIERYVSTPPPTLGTPSRLSQLSTRELDVLTEIARGRSNAEIAGSLVLSEATVKSHVNHIFTKLDLRDRTQAAVLAYETGLVRPGANP